MVLGHGGTKNCLTINGNDENIGGDMSIEKCEENNEKMKWIIQ